MPPKMMKRKAIKKMVKKRIAEAIEEYEKTKANPSNAGGSGPTITGGTVNVQGCSHMTFINGKPHPFNGTEGVIGLRRWIEKGRALTWWNGNVHTLGLINANRIPWNEFKSMMTTEYFPATEIQRMEQELWILTLKGDVIDAYNNRFHKLDLMCPDLVPNGKKKIKRYIRGFPERIKRNITSSRPTTLHDAINMAHELVKQAIQGKAARVNESNKRKWEEHQKNNPNNNNPNNHNHNRNNNNQHHQQNRRQETARAFVATPAETRGYAGNLPMCNHCDSYHNGQCPLKCQRCQRTGHQKKDYRARVPGVVNNFLQNVTCFGCGKKGHYKENILFDSGAKRSFISSEFTPFIDIAPAALNTSYEVELVDGKVVSTNTVLRGCTLALFNNVFKIDLLPTRLGSFDVIIGMDWLSYHRAVIVCYEKIVCIPLPNGEILEIQGERPKKDPRSLSCIKDDEKKLDDIRIVRDFPEVFLDDLTGLPPVREIEFRIDLIPGALPVVKSPYRLAPSEMLELSNQLKELQEKEVQFLGHVVNRDGIYVDPSKVELIAKPLTLLTQKNKTYVWGDKQEEAFHILKEKLCNAPVLALSDGPNDFVVYCDASNQGLRCVLMQRGKSSLKAKILDAQGEASKDLKAPTKWLRGLETHFERQDDGGIYFFDRIWIPSVGGVRKLIMDEAYTTRYSVHLGADKMYYDLRDLYWWPGLLQQPEIPEWKWEKIIMDLVIKLPKSSSGYNAIWVIVDRLTKSAHFLPIREDYKTEKLARIYINEIVVRHGVGYKTKHGTTYHPETDGQSKRTIQTLEDMLRAYVMDFGGSWDTHLPLVEFSYNNSYHKSIKCAPFEALYGQKCRSPVIWAEVRESQLIGPEIVQETTEKIIQIIEMLKMARSHQKSYADKRRKPLEFKVGDRVLLKVSPWKGVVQFGKKGKLAPRYVGPFEIVECVGLVAYRLKLPQELSCIHDMFHVSNLKKFLAKLDVQVPLEEIEIDENLHFVEEPIEIVERDVKKLKRRSVQDQVPASFCLYLVCSR
ncbi:putative reverse transcriptase domain-containing protein [Tanacetum coccineum]